MRRRIGATHAETARQVIINLHAGTAGCVIITMNCDNICNLAFEDAGKLSARFCRPRSCNPRRTSSKRPFVFFSKSRSGATINYGSQGFHRKDHLAKSEIQSFRATGNRGTLAAGYYREVVMKNRLSLTAGCLLIGAQAALASSDDAWKAFAADVETKCRREISKVLKNPKIDVDPFGSSSYGVAVGRGAVIGGKNRKAIVCIYDKKSKTVEISGELRP